MQYQLPIFPESTVLVNSSVRIYRSFTWIEQQIEQQQSGLF